MLAPLWDHLCPKDPISSLLLCTTMGCYFQQLSVDVDPGRPSSGELQWITSEDVNIEHLLDIFMSIDANSKNIWNACANFMYHLRWHRPWLVVLEQKIKGLPDNHPSKPHCLYRCRGAGRLASLFDVKLNEAFSWFACVASRLIGSSHREVTLTNSTG